MLWLGLELGVGLNSWYRVDLEIEGILKIGS